GSGWADAGKAMEGFMVMVIEKARKHPGGVQFKRGKASKLLVRHAKDKERVIGVKLEDGSRIVADLTIVAAGAWSGSLLDLRGRADARGQVIAYVAISAAEKDALKKLPVLLNLSTGMFIIPPVQDPITGSWVIKVARHSYGYGNPTTVESPEGENITTSLPAAQFSPIPFEGEQACRKFLKESIPWLGERPFSGTRICWYTDTPTGDFLIDYHPRYNRLFFATGGSGHGFKFLPVLGDKILAALDGILEEELANLWRWREDRVENFRGTEDGSRGGGGRMNLKEAWREARVDTKSKL
ncbi:hypothetical protein P7C71_g843, partial [Lecanoromycetidae sp. Uapishka_2]